MADPHKPTHAPSPGMDLKMKGPGADSVNRTAFSSRQNAVKNYGNQHVNAHGSEKTTHSASFSQKASQSYQQATTSAPGSKAGHGTLSTAFNKTGRGH